MSQSIVLSRAVPVFMIVVWTLVAATVEAQRLSHKPPLLRGHEATQRMKVGSAAAGAMLAFMTVPRLWSH